MPHEIPRTYSDVPYMYAANPERRREALAGELRRVVADYSRGIGSSVIRDELAQILEDAGARARRASELN